MNLIISDFDGTFYDYNYEENIKYIESIKDKNDFVIATGRHFKSLKGDLETNCKYYICNDGGYILDNKENLIYKKYINENELEKVLDRIKELGYEEYFIDYIDYFDTKINKNAPAVNREPVVDVSKLKDGTSTDATYTTVKTPLVVEKGDIITYTIRVYNEGELAGYAEEVADYLPEGLGLLVNYNDNIDNYWSVTSATSAGAETIKLSDIKNRKSVSILR